MKYAIILDRGKQYKVQEGETILIDRLQAEKDKEIEFPHVLLYRDDDTVTVGEPDVAGANVFGRIVDEIKGKKIHIAKFKAKVRYRRTMGFRPRYTKVIIEKMTFSQTADRKSPQNQNGSKKVNREKKS